LQSFRVALMGMKKWFQIQLQVKALKGF
jgi:hypothetical protein